MKKYLLTIITALTFTLGANAQFFKPADVAKIADYVVSELNLSGSTAQTVKSLYTSYGEQMRKVSESMEGLNAKQTKIQALTNEMDEKVKEQLPKDKIADYETVANHYRKKGISTSALNNTSSTAKTTDNSAKLDEVKDAADKLKEEFKKELGVNDAQADQLVKITVEHNVAKKLINQTYKTDATTRAEKMKELNTKTNTKVTSILNDQQYKKFLAILIKSGQGQ